MRPRSKVTLYSEDDVIVFQRKEQWNGGSIQFAHIVKTEKYEIVQVNGSRFAKGKGVYFVIYKAGFDDICETALSFER